MIKRRPAISSASQLRSFHHSAKKYFERIETLSRRASKLRSSGACFRFGRQPVLRSRTSNLNIERDRMHPDENELRRLLIDGLQGNSDAYRLYLAKLTSLLRPYVNRHLLRVRGSSDDFEDIVQEALISIHAKRHTYEPDLPVTAWAYAITRYKLIDYLRAS